MIPDWYTEIWPERQPVRWAKRAYIKPFVSPVIHRIVNYQSRVVPSLQEACVIAACLRTMMPEQKVEIRELAYLTDFQVECVEYREENRNG